MRFPKFKVGYDKVWRLKVGGISSRTADKSGVVDFLMERLIPSSTSQSNTLKAFNSTSAITLRNGSEESPTVNLGGDFWGGNHKINSIFTATFISCEVYIDGVKQNLNGQTIADSVEIRESYYLPKTNSLSAGFPYQALIKAIYRFDITGFCHFDWTIQALSDLDLDYFGVMQLQNPVYSGSDKLYLYIPKTSIATGTEITSNASDTSWTSNIWDNANDPPDTYRLEVKNSGGTVLFGLIMHYDTVPTTNSYLFRSASKKCYPRGYVSSTVLKAGEKKRLTGYFGCYYSL